MGCLPQALFFNAFQLGIMILNDADVRMRVEANKRASRNNYKNTFKSNPLPMRNNLVEKQVNESQSD